MNKLLLLLLLLCVPFITHGQTKFKKGIRIGANDEVIIDTTSILGKVINVKDYGAVGDGVTIDNTAIKTAMEAAISLNEVLIFPPGTYRCDTVISITGFDKNNLLEVIGYGNVILDFSNIKEAAYGAIVLKSDTITSVVLVSDILSGDTLFRANISGIERGDIVKVYSSNTWYGNAKKGEMVKVRENIGDTLFVIYKSFIDSYTSSSSRIQRMSMASFKMSNITIKYDDIYHSNAVSPANIRLINFQNVIISNVRSYDNKSRNFDFWSCYNVIVRDCVTYESDKYGKGYGVNAAGCQFMLIDNCMFDGVRHGFTTIYGNDHSLPTRFCTIRNSIISNTRDYMQALDTHEESEYIIFDNNMIFNGGVNIRDFNTTITRNTFFVNDGSKTTIQLSKASTQKGGFCEISYNKCVVQNGEYPSFFITTYGSVNGAYYDNIIIKENIVDVNKSFIYLQGNVPNFEIKNLLIKDNIVRKYEDVYGLLQCSSVNLILSSTRILNNRFEILVEGSSAKILLLTCDSINYMEVKNNYFYTDNNSYNIYFSPVKSAGIFILSDNYIEGGRNADAIRIEDVANFYFFTNVIKADITISATTDTAYIVKNIYVNFTLTNNASYSINDPVASLFFKTLDKIFAILPKQYYLT